MESVLLAFFMILLAICGIIYFALRQIDKLGRHPILYSELYVVLWESKKTLNEIREILNERRASEEKRADSL